MKKSEEIQKLKDYIYEICDIIYMECPLEQQDAWLKAMRKRRLYDRDKRMM
jgi:uncharacterized protein YutD